MIDQKTHHEPVVSAPNDLDEEIRSLAEILSNF